MNSTPLPVSTSLTNTPAEPSLHDIMRVKLSERIKSGFMDLIPEETFNQMIDAAVDDFINGPRHKRFRSESVYVTGDDYRNTTGKACYIMVETAIPKNEYNRVRDNSTLPGMIYEEIVKMAKDAIGKAVSEDSRLQQVYNNDIGAMVTPVIEQIITDNAAAFMRGLVNNIVQYTVGSSVNQMRQGNGMNNYVPPAPVF